jgi:hypothetical protein
MRQVLQKCKTMVERLPLITIVKVIYLEKLYNYNHLF